MSLLARLKAYVAHTDERVAHCNLIALVVVSNQPFYPLYVAWLVGGDWPSACWTFLSTPFFAAVPYVARRNAVAGRAMLPIVGLANMALSAKAFGTASGVELFVVPCALIAVLAFRRPEWRIVAGLVALAAASLLLHAVYGEPFGRFSPAQDAAFFSLNAWSVATLTVFALWKFGWAIRAEARARS